MKTVISFICVIYSNFPAKYEWIHREMWASSALMESVCSGHVTGAFHLSDEEGCMMTWNWQHALIVGSGL